MRRLPLTVWAVISTRFWSSVGAADSPSSWLTRPLTVDTSSQAAVPCSTPMVMSPLAPAAWTVPVLGAAYGQAAGAGLGHQGAAQPADLDVAGAGLGDQLAGELADADVAGADLDRARARLPSTLTSPEPVLTDSASATSPAVTVPEPLFSRAEPVTVSTSMLPEPVEQSASWNWPVARRSAESALEVQGDPVRAGDVDPDRRTLPQQAGAGLGRCTTTVCRDCSTVACAIASSPAALSGVSSTVVGRCRRRRR